MPKEAQNSWFRNHRLTLGLTLTELAKQIDAPIQTVSRWEHGNSCPLWPWPLKIAKIFRCSVEEVIEHLWEERKDEPCPRRDKHHCTATTILPDDPVMATLQPALRRYAERARTLLVKVVCANPTCKRSHAYPAGGKHPKLCPRCSKMFEFDATGSLKYKVERTPCACQGYHRYGATVYYGPRCPRVRDFTPGLANEFSSGKRRPQRWSRYKHLEDGKIRRTRTSGLFRVDWKRPFVNLSEKTYRCQSCALASHRFNVQRARLEALTGEKIRSEARHNELWEENYPELTPSWFDPRVSVGRRKQLLRKKGGRDKLYGQPHREATSRGRAAAAWYYPPEKRTLVLCRVCNQLLSYYSSQPAVECHPSCGLEVQRGNATFLPKKKGKSKQNLKRAFSWAVRYLLFDEKLREIAADSDRHHSHQDHMFVTDEIEYIVRHLPLPDRATTLKVALYLREAAIQKGLVDRKSLQARAQSGSEP
jgi:DNA-binding XRE family transcriptional regulator